jgi:hypothetical protein
LLREIKYNPIARTGEEFTINRVERERKGKRRENRVSEREREREERVE